MVRRAPATGSTTFPNSQIGNTSYEIYHGGWGGLGNRGPRARLAGCEADPGLQHASGSQDAHQGEGPEPAPPGVPDIQKWSKNCQRKNGRLKKQHVENTKKYSLNKKKLKLLYLKLGLSFCLWLSTGFGNLIQSYSLLDTSAAFDRLWQMTEGTVHQINCSVHVVGAFSFPFQA